MRRRWRRAVALLSVALGSIGCGSRLDSLMPQRGAPGEEFTINGTDLENLSGPPPVAPRLRRCDELPLEVVQWLDNSMRVRIPANTPAGVYQVYAFGRPGGAYNRPRTRNSLPFWVTAASVPGSVANEYDVQVKSFRARYGKSAEWEGWMLTNRDRYEPVFNAVHRLPCPLTIAVSYQTPLAYNPPWSSESEHMAALAAMGEPVFPGYRFSFLFGADPGATYAQAILGVPGNSSGGGKVLRLHYETIFPHEFGHVVNVLHHYSDADLSTIGQGLHFPPGERGCVMDRNDEQYCSACRAALNVALDVDNGPAAMAASSAILARYPPGW
jgi:hypothetical protein